ncbi:MAG: hypothetical protein E7623_05005 [Ruminococcaceae bacterium]|nr:hypothetical protein [Oscillospiraceae bacterium]
MSLYYMISQLPSLDGIGESTPLPITEERFMELCKRFLGEKELSEIEGITLIPPLASETSSSALIEAWNNNERNLRLTLAKARSDKLGIPLDLQNRSLSIEVLKVANAATEIQNPMEAEIFLLNYRLSFLELLRPTDIFSKDYIFYYGLRLKLIVRIRQFDTEIGKAAYKDIYNSILNRDKSEA